MTQKTLAMRVLDGKRIPYHINHYDESQRDAEEIARQVGAEPDRVFKTLVVVRGAGKPLLVMVAADKQLDLKLTAKAVGEKKVRMASHREAEELTGLQVGGISPLALLNRGFLLCADSDIEMHDWVYVSGGKRGLQLEVPVQGLIRVTGARLMSVSI